MTERPDGPHRSDDDAGGAAGSDSRSLCGQCPVVGGSNGSHVSRFAVRVVQDALNEATAAYWLRRAATFEAARPLPGDYTGQATPDDLAARDARLAATADACRNAAALATMGDPP